MIRPTAGMLRLSLCFLPLSLSLSLSLFAGKLSMWPVGRWSMRTHIPRVDVYIHGWLPIDYVEAAIDWSSASKASHRANAASFVYTYRHGFLFFLRRPPIFFLSLVRYKVTMVFVVHLWRLSIFFFAPSFYSRFFPSASSPIPLRQLEFEYFIHRRCDRMPLLNVSRKRMEERKKKENPDYFIFFMII